MLFHGVSRYFIALFHAVSSCFIALFRAVSRCFTTLFHDLSRCFKVLLCPVSSCFISMKHVQYLMSVRPGMRSVKRLCTNFSLRLTEALQGEQTTLA